MLIELIILDIFFLVDYIQMWYNFLNIAVEMRTNSLLNNSTLKFIKNGPKIHKLSDPNAYKIIEIDLKVDNPISGYGFFFKKDYNSLISYHRDINSNEIKVKIPRPYNNKMLEILNHLQCKYTQYYSVYVSLAGAVSNGTHYIDTELQTAPGWFYPHESGKVIDHVEKAVAFLHGMEQYGHFVLDNIGPLFSLPDEYLPGAVLLLGQNRPYKQGFLNLLGIKNRCIFGNKNEWVACDQVIVATHPKLHAAHYGPPLIKLCSIIEKKLNLDKISAERYVLMNRLRTRVVSNFDDGVVAVKKKFPNIRWEIEKDGFNDVETNIKIYSSIKFMVTVDGSNLHSALFVKRSSVFVIINSEIYDFPNYLLFYAMKMNFVVYKASGLYHDHGGPIDPNRLVQAVEVGLYRLDNKKWPEPEKFGGLIV